MRYFLLLFVCFTEDESIILGSMGNVELGMTLNEINAFKEIDNFMIPRQDYMFAHSFDAFADT